MEVKFTETEIEGAILGNLESVRLIEVLTVLGIHYTQLCRKWNTRIVNDLSS